MLFWLSRVGNTGTDHLYTSLKQQQKTHNLLRSQNTQPMRCRSPLFCFCYTLTMVCVLSEFPFKTTKHRVTSKTTWLPLSTHKKWSDLQTEYEFPFKTAQNIGWPPKKTSFPLWVTFQQKHRPTASFRSAGDSHGFSPRGHGAVSTVGSAKGVVAVDVRQLPAIRRCPFHLLRSPLEKNRA